MTQGLTEFATSRIWTLHYPVRYAGARFNARMTIVRLDDGGLMLHSPGPMTADTVAAIRSLGDVRYIVAPGSFHHLYIAATQRAFPQANTHVCPGIERKQPRLEFDWFLGPTPPAAWADEFDQALIRGARFMWEVAFCHRPTKTLLLVDSIENVTDDTPGVSWQLKAWFKIIFRMWNRPKPAPEYQLGWHDRTAARQSLETILSWDFERIVIGHGDNITEKAVVRAREAWKLGTGD